MAKKLEPFNFKKHKPQDVGLGGPSTEYLVTLDSPDGGVWVVPSIWWDDEGKPTLVENQDKVFEIAKQYEKENNVVFPRFPKGEYKQADMFAQARSKAGGASKGLLANDVSKEARAKAAKTFINALD
jgi:hypothetical protein